MSSNIGFRGHIEAGKDLTHILTPDGGAIPIEAVMEALKFRAESLRHPVTKTADVLKEHMRKEPECNLEARDTAAPAQRTLDAFSINWTVNLINEARGGNKMVVKVAHDAYPDGGLRALLDDLLQKPPAVGEFGHHPDMEQDWLIEVEILDNEFLNMRMEFSNGTPSMAELKMRIWKALHCAWAVKCGNMLRRQGFPNPPPTPAQSGQIDRFQTYSKILGERHVAISKLMHELGSMQFAAFEEDAAKLDMIVGNTQGILYSQRSLLSRVADRLRRIYEVE